MRQLADIVLPAFVLGVAVVAILRPVVIVRWAKRAHPDLPEDDETVLWIARLIGVGGLVLGLFLLMIIARSLSS